MPTDPQPSDSREEETMVCPSCHRHNHPDTKYCPGCGAPLGPTAAWGPWEQTQAEGFGIRQATTTDRPRPILVVGIWFIFLPTLLACVLVFWVAAKESDWAAEDKATMAASLFFGVISAVLLYRSTANYFIKKRRQKNEPA